MKPMISPWTIYFASRADAVGTLFLIVAVAAFAICLIGFDDLTKNGFKLFISIGIISVILTVLTPTTETVYTMMVEHTYKYSMDIQLGNSYDLKPIMKLHKLGYLPIQIRAIPEGTLVPMGIPCIEITNTHPDFAWVVQWIECILQVELWKPCAHATIGHMYRELANDYGEFMESLLALDVIMKWQNLHQNQALVR